MKIELTHSDFETFNEVFVAGQIYIGLGENNPYDARNKKGYKMKKSDTRKINLKKTDFFQNAKFAFCLVICHFLFKKMSFFCISLFLGSFNCVFCILRQQDTC